MVSLNHIDPRHWELIAGARRLRRGARLWTAAVAVVCGFMDGLPWFVGALLGGLVVEANLGLLLRFLSRAAEWRGTSIWPALIRFYFFFGATAVVCFLIIRNQWGHPLAFLLGLLSFFAGLVLALISLAVRKPAPDPAGAKGSEND